MRCIVTQPTKTGPCENRNTMSRHREKRCHLPPGVWGNTSVRNGLLGDSEESICHLRHATGHGPVLSRAKQLIEPLRGKREKA